MSRRILFAIHGPRDPGTAVYLTVSRRAAFLRERGHTVAISTPADFRSGGWSRLQPLLLPIELASRHLAAYDVVVFHSYLGWAPQIRSTLSRRRKPATVVAFHGLEPLYHDAVAAELARTGERLSRRFELLHRVVMPHLLALASRRADRVFCLNSAERRFVIEHGWADASKALVMPNGVEPELFLPRATYAPRSLRVLFTGQWLRAKGIRHLARAFEAIAAAHPDVELTCLGTGAAAEAVRADFAASVQPRVRVRPRVDRTELAEELARADLFMFPSLSEGFSGALLEAMAAALPVIATAAGAAADLLRHGENALLVPFADAEALAAAAARLIDSPDERGRLGIAAQVTARRYEWGLVNEAFADEIVRLGDVAS